jgi:hypothetical protein
MPIRSASERGTAIFVVVLVVTLLTGIGIFSARITTSVDSATGYVRQSAQAQSLSIYASQLAANMLTNQAGLIKDTMETSAATNQGAGCPSNRGFAGGFCAFRNNAELTSLVASTTITLLAPQQEATPGSLGPKHGQSTVAGIEGVMQIEFIDVARAIPRAGASMGSASSTTEIPYEFGANAWAQIRPTITALSTNWCQSDAAATNANVQATRLYISVPRL